MEEFAAVHRLPARGCVGGSLKKRIATLCVSTDRWRAAGREVRTIKSVEDADADEETRLTVCAITAEFITSALRHAFPVGAQ